MKRIIWTQCAVEALVWANLFIDILPKEIKHPSHNNSKVAQCPENPQCFTTSNFVVAAFLDALCDCLFILSPMVHANPIVLWWYFNVITYVKALNPKPT